MVSFRPLAAAASFTAPAAAAPASDSFSFTDTAKLLGGGAAAQGSSWNPFSFATYQQYFDVDTADIVDRLRYAAEISLCLPSGCWLALPCLLFLLLRFL